MKASSRRGPKDFGEDACCSLMVAPAPNSVTVTTRERLEDIARWAELASERRELEMDADLAADDDGFVHRKLLSLAEPSESLG